MGLRRVQTTGAELHISGLGNCIGEVALSKPKNLGKAGFGLESPLSLVVAGLGGGEDDLVFLPQCQ